MSQNWMSTDDDGSFVCHYASVERQHLGNGDSARGRQGSETESTTDSKRRSSTPLSSNLLNVPSSPHRHKTPRRNAGMAALAPAFFCTPQPCKRLLELQQELDDELDAVNSECRKHRPPAFTPVCPGLFVGGFPTTETLEALHSRGVRHVITLCGDERSMEVPPKDCQFSHQVFHVRDANDYFIIVSDYDAFLDAVEEPLLRGEGVFVHCIAGVNRSVTLCVAYLIHRMRLTPLDSVRRLRANGRSVLLDNRSFRRQLIEFYLELPPAPSP